MQVNKREALYLRIENCTIESKLWILVHPQDQVTGCHTTTELLTSGT